MSTCLTVALIVSVVSIYPEILLHGASESHHLYQVASSDSGRGAWKTDERAGVKFQAVNDNGP